MKIKTLLASALAMVAALVSCQEEEELGMASLELVSESTITLEKTVSTATIEFKATRAWTLTAACEGDWLSFSKDKGEGSSNNVKVEVTALANAGVNREGTVTISLATAYGALTKEVTVKQNGSGEVNVYYNNFDKAKAAQSSSKWPDLTGTEWRNETGSGIATVSYCTTGTITVRSNGKSSADSGYTAYEGSGVNRLWYGTGTPSLTVKDITLPDGRNYKVSFGGERALYGVDDNTFKHDEFSIYISDDNSKWVKLEYAFEAGIDPVYSWDRAASYITLPAGVTKLSICYASSLASAYAVDDIALQLSDQEGTLIEFSTGTTLDIGSAIEGGSSTPSYNESEVTVCATIGEFLTKSVSETAWYRVNGEVTKLYSSSSSFDFKDATGEVQAYRVTNYSTFNPEVGGKVTIVGHRGQYVKNETTTIEEVTEGVIEQYTAPSGSSEIDSTTIYSIKFTKTDEGWTEDYKTKDSGVTAVWTRSSQYGMIASAYVDGDAAGSYRAVESWLVSPEIDLTGQSGAILYFTQVCNQFSDIADLPIQCTLWISANGGDYTQVTIPSYPATLSWSASNSGNIDLKDYLGKKIKLGFCYKSTAASCGKWEIESLSIVKELKQEEKIDGTVFNWAANSSHSWAEDSVAVYKNCLLASDSLKVGIYKFNSTTAISQANQLKSDHLRIYKAGAISVEFPDSRTMKQIVLSATGSSYCLDLDVVEGSGTVTTNSSDNTMVWTGNASKVVLSTPDGQIRISNIKIIY